MQVILNNKKARFEKGETILQLARRKGIDIPTLCYHEEFGPEGRCRLCVVEVNGELRTSCDTRLKEGMNIITDSAKIRKSRAITRKLLEERMERIGTKKSNEPIVLDHAKCIVCRACVNVCEIMQEVFAIDGSRRGIETKIATPFDSGFINSPCTFCGQCTLLCDPGAITERDDTEHVAKALKSRKHVIVQTAPSIRASLGELFDMPHGSLVTGRMVTALRKLGFDRVFDTDFGADMTTFEETNEFLKRLKENKLPMFTSCCPAWIRFAEYNYPEFLKCISTCKSPHMMFGAVAKSYYAKKFGIKPGNITVVSVMPCTAKKYEIARPEMQNDRERNVDIVITTREAAKLLKAKKIDLKKMKQSEFDDFLGVSSGSGAIYGVTGGVMESIIRSAKHILGEKMDKIEFKSVRGFEGIKEADIKLGNRNIRVAVAHGLRNIRKVLEMIKKGKRYHMVEMMACPGGCIGGGGQPRPKKNSLNKRSAALYTQDRKLKIRIANDNPTLIEVYKKYLKRPLSRKAHKFLHTGYRKRRLKIR